MRAYASFTDGGRVLLLDDGIVVERFSVTGTMGIATDGVAVWAGTPSGVVELPEGQPMCGAGDDIHDVFLIGGEVHYLATSLAAICRAKDGEVYWSLDVEHPEDRLHLSGIGMRDGKPSFASSLSDGSADWREEPLRGSIWDVASGEIVVTGLDQPHAPRWHDGALWFLESRLGSLCRFDGTTEIVAKIDGFPKALAMTPDGALVGSSIGYHVGRSEIALVDLDRGAQQSWYRSRHSNIFDVQVVGA